MEQKLRILKVLFNGELKAFELPAFRGAMAQLVGYENILFHNHRDGGFRYRYPLIQYKLLHQRPAMICLKEGIDEMQHLFAKSDWAIQIGDREMELSVSRLDVKLYTVQVWDQLFTYRIRNWLGLSNAKSWQEYQRAPGMRAKLEMLEKKLIGNILSFAKGIDWHVDRNIELHINHIHRQRKVRVKNNHQEAFDLEFQTNVFLPNDIGLGKHSSLGYGTVWQHRVRQEAQPVAELITQTSRIQS